MTERNSWAVGSDADRKVTTEDARIALASLLTPTGSGIGTRNGFRPYPAGNLVTASSPSPDTNIRVAAFQYVMNASRGTGPYIATNDAIKTVDVLAGNPANPSNPRNDLIVMQQSDQFYSDPLNVFEVKRITGTPSGSPVDPSVPGSPDYVILARIVVPAGATSITNANITNLNQTGSIFTVAAGGILPITSVANRPTAPFTGMTINRTDLGVNEAFDGTNWRIRDILAVSTYASIATAVTNPYDGQIVTVQDTDLTYQYNGTIWRVISQIVVANFAALATAVQNPYDGQLATVQDTNTIYQHDGSNWVVYKRVTAGSIIDTGSVAVTAAAAKTFISQAITVPSPCTLVEFTFMMASLSAVQQYANFYVVTLGGSNCTPNNLRHTPAFTATVSFASPFTVWMANPPTGSQTLVLSCASIQSTGNMQALVVPKYYT